MNLNYTLRYIRHLQRLWSGGLLMKLFVVFYAFNIFPLVVVMHLACVLALVTIGLPLLLLTRIRLGMFFFVGGD
jgi:hypothetical protein